MAGFGVDWDGGIVGLVGPDRAQSRAASAQQVTTPRPCEGTPALSRPDSIEHAGEHSAGMRVWVKKDRCGRSGVEGLGVQGWVRGSQ